MSKDFSELRRGMVDSQVRTTDVTEHRLLSALLDVPREDFVPQHMRAFAYTDTDIAVTSADASVARYVVEPSPFAKLVQLASIGPDDLVLDIGCASGYSSAVLSRLGAAIIAVESDSSLADKASETLSANGFDNVAVVSGPLEDGYEGEGPYDVIFVGGAVDYVPQSLLDQLKKGGRLVAVIGHGLSGAATLFVRDDEGEISERRAFNLAVPALPGFQKSEEFVF